MFVNQCVAFLSNLLCLLLVGICGIFIVIVMWFSCMKLLTFCFNVFWFMKIMVLLLSAFANVRLLC